MLLAEAHLANGEQHARAGHAADLARFQRDAGARDEAARRREHALHAGARIRRAAHDGDDAVAGVHLAGAQPVRVRMLHGLHHMRDAERRQLLAGTLHALHFEPDRGERVGDPLERRVGVEMRLAARTG